MLIIFIISDDIRVCLIRSLLPKSIKTLLYEKSVVDLLTQSSSSRLSRQPSIIKYFCSLLIYSCLNDDEKIKIVMSLPEDMKYLKQPGIISLLPVRWRVFLGGSRFNEDFHDYNNSNRYHEGDDDLIGVNHNTIDHNNNNTTYSTNTNTNTNTIENDIADINSIPIFNLPSAMIISSADVDDDNYNLQNTSQSTTVSSFASSNDATNSNNSVNNSNNNYNNDNFEEIVNEIVRSRAMILLQRVHTSITNTMMKILSGGDIDDSTLLSSFLVSTSALYCILSMDNYSKLKLMTSSSSLHHIQNVICALLSPILTITSLAVGSAICIRHRHPIMNLYSQIGKYKTQVEVLVAITLVTSLAIKLKIRIRHLKWMYQIVLIRILETLRNIEGSIQCMIE